MIEFAINNHVSFSTNVSPFFAIYDHNPRMHFDPESINPEQRDHEQFAARMQDIHDHCYRSLCQASEDQVVQVNRHRLSASHFQLGDIVYLNTVHLKRQRPTAKLDHVRAGPYPITRVISPIVMELQLPVNSRIDRQFHVSLLTPASPNPYPEQQEEQPPPIDVENNRYELERILDSRYRWNRLEYLVKWRGYNETTWERWDRLDESEDAKREYHRSYPDKPGLTTTLSRGARQ